MNISYPYVLGSGRIAEESKKNYQDEPHEYIIICGGGGTFASRPGGVTYYDINVYILGYIDLNTGERCDGKHLISWRQDDGVYDRDLYRELFKDGKMYRIEAMPTKESAFPKPLRLLAEVKHNGYLKGLLEEFNKPVFMHSDLFGEMPLNKRYGSFSADFNWLGTTIEVSFNTDEGDDEGCLANLEAFCRDAERWDREMREYSADNLTYLANDWRDDDHLDEEITEEDFKRRIVMSSVSVSADGDFFVYFDDDDMFAGHSVEVHGNLEKGCHYSDLIG